MTGSSLTSCENFKIATGEFSWFLNQSLQPNHNTNLTQSTNSRRRFKKSRVLSWRKTNRSKVQLARWGKHCITQLTWRGWCREWLWDTGTCCSRQLTSIWTIWKRERPAEVRMTKKARSTSCRLLSQTWTNSLKTLQQHQVARVYYRHHGLRSSNSCRLNRHITTIQSASALFTTWNLSQHRFIFLKKRNLTLLQSHFSLDQMFCQTRSRTWWLQFNCRKMIQSTWWAVCHANQVTIETLCWRPWFALLMLTLMWLIASLSRHRDALYHWR